MGDILCFQSFDNVERSGGNDNSKTELKDITGIAKVHVDSWRTTYKGIVPDTFLNSLTYESREQIWKRGIEKNHVYIAENENNQIVGFATGGKERTGKYEAYKGELYAIYLLESAARKRNWTKAFQVSRERFERDEAEFNAHLGARGKPCLPFLRSAWWEENRYCKNRN